MAASGRPKPEPELMTDSESSKSAEGRIYRPQTATSTRVTVFLTESPKSVAEQALRRPGCHALVVAEHDKMTLLLAALEQQEPAIDERRRRQAHIGDLDTVDRDTALPQEPPSFTLG